MTTPTGLAVLSAHDAAQARLLDRGLAEVTLAFQTLLDPYDLDGSARQYVPLTSEILARNRAASAGVARDFYGVLRDVETAAGGRAAPFVPPVPESPPTALLTTSTRVTGPVTVKAGVANGLGTEEAMLRALTATLGSATRIIEGGARDVTRLAVASDPAARGWLRRSGGSPCSFCAMLISRGPAYKSEGTSSFRAHDHCHCKAVPFFGSDSGWTEQSAEFREMWDAAKANPDKDVTFESLYRQRYSKRVSPADLRAEADALNATRVVVAPSTSAARAAGRLTREQYDVMLPDSAWSAEKRDAILSELRSTENGKVLADTLDKFQDGGSIARLRTSIDKRLAGEDLPEMSAKRADAVIDALRHAPSDNVPEILYRGMSVSGSQATVLRRYAEGADLDLNLTSFSSDRKVATRFQSMTAKKGTTRVMVELIGDDKAAIPIQNLARDRRLFKEKEWVGGGKYEIAEAKKSPSGGVILRIRQKGRI